MLWEKTEKVKENALDSFAIVCNIVILLRKNYETGFRVRPQVYPMGNQTAFKENILAQFAAARGERTRHTLRTDSPRTENALSVEPLRMLTKNRCGLPQTAVSLRCAFAQETATRASQPKPTAEPVETAARSSPRNSPLSVLDYASDLRFNR